MARPEVTEPPAEAAESPAEPSKPVRPRVVVNVPRRPEVIKPAGPKMEAPKAAELKGPKVVRIEKPDEIRAPRPRRPVTDIAAQQSDLIRSRGPVRGKGAGGRQGDCAQGAGLAYGATAQDA